MKYFLILFSAFIFGAAQAITLQEARSYITNKDYAQAVLAYRTLMQQQPALARNAECNKFLGQALCMTGQYAESVPYLELATKQGNKGAWWYLGISRQHLYDFEGAVTALEKYKKLCGKTSPWIPRTDSIIAECEIGLKGIRHVQDVVILDSMLVPRQQFFAHYRLGAESGRMIAVEGIGNADGAVYENQTADHRLYADVDTDGVYRLYETTLFNGEWSEPSVVSSISVGTRKLCFPFLTSDSETLYFACDSTPGYGGLDIYKTHYNFESDCYYTPERMDMPFNSPYDDYLMAIDETHQVGWWATDRSVQDKSLVCIYLFQISESPSYLEGENPGRARIDRIADTWQEENGYADFVQEVLNAPQEMQVVETLQIPITDGLVYTSVDQFKSSQAREAYQQSVKIEENLAKLRDELAQLREEWHNADDRRRKQLTPVILRDESQEAQLMGQLAESQKKYRNLEIGKKK